MQPTTTADVAVLLTHDPAAGARRALLTYYDDATGERVELTAPALGSWAARTAALLRHGCRLDRGARAAVLLPPHWQTAAILLGAWSAGIAVAYRSWATAGLAPVGPGMDEPLEAVFVSRKRLDSWLETVPAAHQRFVLGLAPGGAPMAEVPAGYRDYVTEVGRYADLPPEYESIGRDDAASPDGTSYREWAALAGSIADSLGLRAGDRLLVDVAEHEEPVTWLLAPLVVGASVVLCANLDRSAVDARIAAEGVTHVL
ncbi:TIGR03089 family protein [Planosporangium sp. 12N6]|uniref:TIGR03089 family protein n=1 Tax=Planosporangium spinosum TaxID=3402278 RepID=UPI003CEA31D1